MLINISKHKICLAVLDIIILSVGFYVSFWYVFESGLYYLYAYPDYFLPLYTLPTVVIAIIVFVIVFQLDGLYKYQSVLRPFHQFQSLLRGYLKVFATFILIIFFMKPEYIADSRITIIVGFSISFVLMIVFRIYLVPRFFYLMVEKRLFTKRVLIMGAGEHGRIVYNFLKNNPRNYFDIQGFCDDDDDKIDSTVCDMNVLGSSNDMQVVVQKYNIREVIIAISNIDRNNLLDLIDRCKSANVVVHVISDLFNKVTEKMEAEEFCGLTTYRILPNTSGIVLSLSKRMLDFVCSVILLIIFSPLFLLIAWVIKQDSDGPIFYRTKVIGKDGKAFIAYKFRSMISEDTSKYNDKIKYDEGRKRHTEFMRDFIQGKIKEDCFVKDESRVTKVGQFLRKYSLDELPQLFNVLVGDMSLVGPRFCSSVEYSFYKPWHRRRFQMKPGMTGLWQVRARSTVSYDDMVILDLYYIQNWSLLFDVEIMLRTIAVVLTGRGSRVR